MSDDKHYYKNVRIRPAGNGWVVECTKYTENKSNEYDGYRHLGDVEEVFEDPTDATDRAEEIYNSDMYIPKTDGGMVKSKG